MLFNISLKNFRSYSEQSFEFNDGVNIIVGPNGSGKTNLLESILLLCHNKTFRPVKITNLIKKDEEWFRLSANDSDDLNRVLSCRNDLKMTKKYSINDVLYKRLPVNKKIPFILFEPNNLSLFSSNPEKRRNYFDELLEKTDDLFDETIKKYRRTLLQRNFLLKKDNLVIHELFPWNLKLAELASIIVSKRLALVAEINNDINQIYDQIAGNSKYKIIFSYQPLWPEDIYASKFLSYLENEINNDIKYGYTTIGPHKDDINTKFNNQDSKEVASRGEMRTLILALKIQEATFIEKKINKRPIFLLDDVFSELDGKRRNHLIQYINSYQTFITTTDADLAINNFNQTANLIPLVN